MHKAELNNDLFFKITFNQVECNYLAPKKKFLITFIKIEFINSSGDNLNLIRKVLIFLLKMFKTKHSSSTFHKLQKYFI